MKVESKVFGEEASESEPSDTVAAGARRTRKGKSKAPPSKTEDRAPEIVKEFYARATRPISFGLLFRLKFLDIGPIFPRIRKVNADSIFAIKN